MTSSWTRVLDKRRGQQFLAASWGVVQVSYSVSVDTEQGDAPCPGSYLTLSGFEGQGCLASAPQLFSADGVEGLASLLPGHYPAVTEPNGGAGGTSSILAGPRVPALHVSSASQNDSGESGAWGEQESKVPAPFDGRGGMELSFFPVVFAEVERLLSKLFCWNEIGSFVRWAYSLLYRVKYVKKRKRPPSYVKA